MAAKRVTKEVHRGVPKVSLHTIKNATERTQTTADTTVFHLFTRASKEVPAYQSFLKDNAFDSKSVRTVDDVKNIPPVDKKNYLRNYPYKELFWKGTLATPQILTSTSGSTGAPVYFSRNKTIDDHAAEFHEMFFQSTSLKKDASTLVVVCFGMGVWIGGIITYQAFELLGRRGYPFAVITPGLNKKEIIKILRDLLPQYDQLILAGYPPFLKDVIDEALNVGVDFSKKRTALLFAAETFTETFRDHIAKKVDIRSVITDTANVYGSADMGTMAIETPVSIAIRRLAMKNLALFSDLFRGNSLKTPTFAQFNPAFVAFEESEGQLLLSANSTMPLIRYAIGDIGGVHTYDEVKKILRAHNYDMDTVLKEAGAHTMNTKLPFVYVYERKDFVTTLYGLQIYPELIREVLLDNKFENYLTGKFALSTKYDDAQNQFLEVNLELKPHIEDRDVPIAELTDMITRNLENKSSEYRELVESIGERAKPALTFWHYEDPTYFTPGIKQRWVIIDK